MLQHSPSEKFKRVMVAAALALLPLLYFYPVLTQRVQLMPGDGWTQNLGIRVLTGRLIAQGILPLWNPYIFAGMPLLASIQPGVLYPPNWLFAVFSPGVAMNVLVITTYHLALIGSYLYARRTGMTRLGALVTGIIFSFGGLYGGARRPNESACGGGVVAVGAARHREFVSAGALALGGAGRALCRAAAFRGSSADDVLHGAPRRSLRAFLFDAARRARAATALRCFCWRR